MDDGRSKLNGFLDQLARSSSYPIPTISLVAASTTKDGEHTVSNLENNAFAHVQNAIYNSDFVSCDGKKSMWIFAPTKSSVHMLKSSNRHNLFYLQPTAAKVVGWLVRLIGGVWRAPRYLPLTKGKQLDPCL